MVRLLLGFEKPCQNHHPSHASPPPQFSPLVLSHTWFASDKDFNKLKKKKALYSSYRTYCKYNKVSNMPWINIYGVLHRNLNKLAFRKQLRKGLCICTERTEVWICPAWVHSFQAFWALKRCLLPLFLKTAYKTHFGRKEMGGTVFYKGAKRSCVRKQLI